MPNEVRLEPPPRFELLPENPPSLVPHLRELPPFPGPVPDETEPFVSDYLEDPLAGRIDEIRDRVMRSERLQGIHGRSADLGAGRRGKRAADERPTVLYVVWDYEAGVSIETTLDEETLEILDVVDSVDHPVISQDEIDRAVEIAMADDRLRSMVEGTEGLVGMALLASPVDPQDELFGHRILDVRLVCPDERLPRASAMVDLTRETVLGVGGPCRRRAAEEGEH